MTMMIQMTVNAMQTAVRLEWFNNPRAVTDNAEGFTIIQSSESIPSTYCTNQTWVDQLNRCLSCTNRDDDDDIWEDYGSSVSAAAQACGGQTASPGAVLSTDSATGTATAPAVTRISGTATSTGPLSAPTAVGDCHTHGDDLYCIADNVEWEVTSNIDVNNAPDSYDNCRPTDDDDMWVFAASRRLENR